MFTWRPHGIKARFQRFFTLIVHICKENTCTCDLWVISCYNNNDNYYLTNLVFLVCTASYESLFFLNIDLWPMRFVLGP